MKRIDRMKQWVNDHQEHVSVALVSAGVTMVVVGTVALVAVVKNDHANNDARQVLDSALPGSKLIMPFKGPDGDHIVLTKREI
jgi:hypothetical protein